MASLRLSFLVNLCSKTHLGFGRKFNTFIFASRATKKSKRVSLSICSVGSSFSSQSPENIQETGKVDYASLSAEEWKKKLIDEQFYITRQKGTERAFTGEYWNTKTAGTYDCICCDTPIFESSTKFDNGTGWPSYYRPIGNNVKSKLDLSIIFMPRQEVVCAACDARLGHVFDDEPPPTGKRYCIKRSCINAICGSYHLKFNRAVSSILEALDKLRK
ncbi:peptide methionine sulfoxide reductase B1, chloroplastic [Tripterygium wilfordii]|uniref:peptide methionine sulfoxide reductase B1, chloroplastic n=1 Tax=Tripterygium wilfordii TaxID=458696 RepID=UPI0018F82BB3|nr:peptide methionine sulfoxide reductase B1, chloroplastic [Tripterygium wilfordii]